MAGARLYALAEHGADVRPELMTVAQRSCAPAASHPCSWVVASHSCHAPLQVGPVRRRHAHDAPEGFEIENEVRWRWPLGPTIGLPPTPPALPMRAVGLAALESSRRCIRAIRLRQEAGAALRRSVS
jgi:hypothetical protein